MLYQDAIDQPGLKPPVSTTQLLSTKESYKELLPCHVVKPFFKPTVRPSLPSSFKVIEQTGVDLTDIDAAVTKSLDVEFLITLMRCGLQNDSQSVIQPWSGIHALITEIQAPLMRVGFLPILPEPVTEYATVRQSLTNFQCIRKKLGQDMMPIFCDEGVFQIVVDIMLNEPSVFADLFAMLGTLHMEKVLLKCCGRYLVGSGIDDALIEGEVFGKKVLVSVLYGSHYVRSLEGMFVVSEALYMFAWEAFLETKKGSPEMESVRKLRNCVLLKKRDQCLAEFDQALECSRKLKRDFETFIREREEKLCKYFSVFQDIFTVIKKSSSC